jgi:putative FmdB family regulatory protein
MPIYDYECAAHGKFEVLAKHDAPPAKCPHGCGAGMVKRLPVLKSNIIGSAAKNTDKMAQQMMDNFGIGDMRPSQGVAAISAKQPYRWNDPGIVQSGVATSVPYSIPVDAPMNHKGVTEGDAVVSAIAQSVGARLEETSPVEAMQKAGTLGKPVIIRGNDRAATTVKGGDNANS